MEKPVSDDVIEYISVLAGLEIYGEEKEQAKQDMARMLEHIDKLKELDTSEAEALCHVIPIRNVFREDVVTNGDESRELLQNAPYCRDNMFVAPRTF